MCIRSAIAPSEANVFGQKQKVPKLPANVHDYDPAKVTCVAQKTSGEGTWETSASNVPQLAGDGAQALSLAECDQAGESTPDEMLLEISRRLFDSAAYPGPNCLTSEAIVQVVRKAQLTTDQSKHAAECIGCSVLLRAAKLKTALPEVIQAEIRRPESEQDRSVTAWAGRIGEALRAWLLPPKLAWGFAFLIVLGFGGFMLKNAVAEPPYLAVQPFDFGEGKLPDMYYAYGIAEGMTSGLGTVGKLNVVSWNSTSRIFSNGRPTSAEWRRAYSDLNVDQIITGKVSKPGNYLLVSVRGVEPSTGKMLWQTEEKVSSENILYIEKKFTSEIAHRVGLDISTTDIGGLTRAGPVNPKAYELYLSGRYHLNQRDLKQSCKDLEAAREKDNGFGPTHASLAICYNLRVLRHELAPAQGYPEALESAQQAMNLDERLPEAHAALALSTMYFQPDWKKAEKGFLQALELNPGYSSAHHWYGILLSNLGRHGEGIESIQRAIKLDPLSPYPAGALGDALLLRHDFAGALKQYLETQEKFKNLKYVSKNLASTYLYLGRHEHALSALKMREQGLGSDPEQADILSIQAERAYIYAVAGSRDRAITVLNKLTKPELQAHTSPYEIAMIYAALGDKEKALQLLHDAHKQNSAYLIQLKVDPAWDSLQSDSRFIALLRLRNFPMK